MSITGTAFGCIEADGLLAGVEIFATGVGVPLVAGAAGVMAAVECNGGKAGEIIDAAVTAGVTEAGVYDGGKFAGTAVAARSL